MPRFATLFAIAGLILLTLVTTPIVQAQTFTVLHNFKIGGADGTRPVAGLIADEAGNLYGTATGGGKGSGGVVFQMANNGHGWVFTPLYAFKNYSDGSFPTTGVTFGRDGHLYGTTSIEGSPGCSGNGCGTVFGLQPASQPLPRVFSGWPETFRYQFAGGSDAGEPSGELASDQAGNVYGTSYHGGSRAAGTVYQFTPSNGGWTESVAYSFLSGNDGRAPLGRLVFDSAGNMYGVTGDGGLYGYGTVFELSPSASGWTETTLYAFQNGDDGEVPAGGLIFDGAGNLFGSTGAGGANGGGTVFELSPQPGGGWTFTTLYSFTGHLSAGPSGSLAMDAAGNLYGALASEGLYYEQGSVFKLTPGKQGWTYTDLHDFTGGSDGDGPYGGLLLDAGGNLYGTTYDGGAYGYGVVYELTP